MEKTETNTPDLSGIARKAFAGELPFLLEPDGEGGGLFYTEYEPNHRFILGTQRPGKTRIIETEPPPAAGDMGLFFNSVTPPGGAKDKKK